MSLPQFAHKIVQQTLEEPGDTLTLEGGEPVNIHAILISESGTTLCTFEQQDAPGSGVWEDLFGGFIVITSALQPIEWDIPWTADKGFRIVGGNPTGTMSVTIFYSQLGT